VSVTVTRDAAAELLDTLRGAIAAILTYADAAAGATA
jgi:hypothetical protein